MFKTNVGSVQLDTPLLLASGYITETAEFFLRSQPMGCSGIITRSLKRQVPPERQHIPVPRYAIFEQKSMLNCEWGNERHWSTWKNEEAQKVRESKGTLIISLSGRDPHGCAELMGEFDAMGIVDAYEVNVSCSHSGALHGNLNVDIEHLEGLMATIRKATQTPIWIKLSYSTQLIQMALIAERDGADTIVCSNSIGPGMLIDTKAAVPQLGIQGGGGGLTGNAIFPIALWCVHQLSNSLEIPVVGCGGVSSGDHAIQMLMAGASAIQLYTAPALYGPRVFRRVLNGIERYLEEHTEYQKLEDLNGVVSQRTTDHQFASPFPEVLEEKCTGCGVCIDACAFDALSLVTNEQGEDIAVIKDTCVSCNACVGVCPPKFDAIKARFRRSR